jgi:hypothetical protein
MSKSSRGLPHHRQSARRHFRNGHRAAALRAVTGARLYIGGSVNSYGAAAEACGSNPVYVRAAVTLCQSESSGLLNQVLKGSIPLLGAAAKARQLARLVDAYRAASTEDRVQFARVVGPTSLFDNTLVPSL